mmetsp:Transcript_99209/g.318351  ORF Transcript_99209/g.318351 Transcript_99209/m.318351 type:complete len:195 (-) Transcript_99209:800-1384(-)
MYTLEYALRYAMVPGRVENWVVIIDLANVMSVISPLHIGSLVSVATAIGTTLEKVYCGRMVWIKIINMPGGALLNRAINGAIPAEKKDKVGFPRDYKEDLAKHFEANQLEQRYGGIATDLEPAETYPYHFFPRPLGELAVRGPAHTPTPWRWVPRQATMRSRMSTISPCMSARTSPSTRGSCGTTHRSIRNDVG